MIPFGGFLRNLESTPTGVNRRSGSVRSADDKGDLCSGGKSNISNLWSQLRGRGKGRRRRRRARDDVIAIISGAIPRNVGRAKL